MSSTKKVLLIIGIIFVGGCALLIAVFAANSFLFEKKNPIPTPLVIITDQPASNILRPKPTAANASGSRSIPFQSVVLITALYNENGSLKEGWSGSGTFISTDGLILTNAHVVLPDKNFSVDALTVAPTFNADQKPQPAYYAKVVQADARLDLAILKITSDINGNPIDIASLNFPAVKLGDSDNLSLGDKLTILGYPGIGGDTITLTSGEVAGFTGESPYGNRAYIKTSATIAGGNSGGLAANDAGELVGIPTQLGSGSDTGIVDCRTLADTNGDGMIDENDTCIPTGGFINSLRPVNLASKMIEAARRGEENVTANNGPQETTAPGSTTSLMTDDFSNSTSGWTIQTDTDGSVGYSNNMYDIRVTSPEMVISGTSGYESNNVVVNISAQVIQSTGNGDFGLVCRQQQDGSYYAFEVREDGYASIWKNNSGYISPLVDWDHFTELGDISTVNLTALCVGDQLGLGVNGKLLISATDTDYQGGDIGLIAGTRDVAGFEVGFDNFEVRSPK